MENKLLEKVNQVIQEKVRPALQEHGGDIDVLSLEGGVLKVKFLGQCAGCPSASLTRENLVENIITEAIPEIKSVVLVSGVSDEMLAMAREIMQNRKRNEDRS